MSQRFSRAGAGMASKIAAVVARFPERELEIHRQYARDPKFQEICEDYSDALVALRHWEGAGPAGATGRRTTAGYGTNSRRRSSGSSTARSGRRPRPTTAEPPAPRPDTVCAEELRQRQQERE